MTSIVRVKRKRNEDPADSLLLSCKKKRNLDLDEVTSLFSFVGTLDSKDAPVPAHITEIIRQTKTHRLQHPHSSDFQRKSHNPEEINRLRQQSQQSSKAKRYHITSRHRALDVEIPGTDLEQEPLKDSECGKESLKSDAKEISSANINSNTDDSIRKGLTTQTNVLPQHLCHEKTCCQQKEEVSSPTNSVPCTDSGSVLLNGDKMLCSAVGNTKQSEQQQKATGNNPLVLEDEQVVCMLDVENVPEKESESSAQHVSSSGITLNGVPMVSRKRDTPADDVGETEYVYDLYYTNTNLSELDLEAVLTVEALWEELCVEDETFRDCDPINEESEDSNDEGNWRNDYPDEDPGFFENEGHDYDYEDNMVESNFTGHDEDDVGALTAYWMDSMCRLDAGDNLDRDEDDDENDGSESDDDYDKLDF